MVLEVQGRALDDLAGRPRTMLPVHVLWPVYEGVTMKIVVKSVTCPRCGAGEMHPRENWLLIRAFKVLDNGHWWSQCLVCAGYYDADLNVLGDAHMDSKKGWF